MVINKHLFAFLIVLTVLAEVKSQLNVKVGYNAQYTEYKETNKLFASFNKNTTDLNQPFEAFILPMGLELGARMMISNRTAIDGELRVFSPQTMQVQGIFQVPLPMMNGASASGYGLLAWKIITAFLDLEYSWEM